MQGPGNHSNQAGLLSAPHDLPAPSNSTILCGLGLGFLALGLFLNGCSRHPAVVETDGEVLVHQEAKFSILLPTGWQVHRSRDGFSLVRTAAYGGGYPTLNIRRIGFEEARALTFDGDRFHGAAGKVDYRYQRWSNSRGRGYRLEALVWTGKHHLFADASVWDPSLRMDRGFFDREFWPIINAAVVLDDDQDAPD